MIDTFRRFPAMPLRRRKPVLKKVVLIALPGVAPFEFGVICEVFGIDRTDSGGPT